MHYFLIFSESFYQNYGTNYLSGPVLWLILTKVTLYFMRFYFPFSILLLFQMAVVPGSPMSQTPSDLADRYMERAIDLYNQSLYDSLPWYYNKAREIYHEAGNHEGTSNCMLGMAEYYRLNNELVKAEAILDTAVSFVTVQIGLESIAWSDVLYFMAKLRLSLNRMQEALEIIDDCLTLRVRLNAAPEKIARAKNVLGSVYHYLGDYQNAEKLYLDAYGFFSQQTPEATVEKGWMQNNLAIVYGQLRDWDKQLAYSRLAIQNSIALYGEDFTDLGLSYTSLSNYYIANGNIDSARLSLDRAEDLFIKTYGKDHYSLEDIYTNRARILSLEGNYYSALEYYIEIERILPRTGQGDNYMSYIRNINTANLYRELGEYQEAGHYYDRLLGAEGKVHPSRMAQFYQYLAINHTTLGNFQLAESYFKKLFKGRNSFYPDDYYGKAIDLSSYGELLDSLKRFEEADEYFYQAVKTARNLFGNEHRSTAIYLKYAGDHFLRAGDARKALEYYQESLQSIVPAYNKDDPAANPDVEEIQDRMFLLGLLKQKAASLEILAGQSNQNQDEYLSAAFNAYRMSVQLTGYLRNSYLNDRSKLYLSENERGTYEDLVRCAYELYEKGGDSYYLDEAFIAAEKAKYATLVSVLQRSGALALAGIPDSVREMEVSLQKEVAVYRELLFEAQTDTLVDSTRVQQVRSRLFALSNEIEQLNQFMEREFPEYYQLLYNPQVADPHLARESLKRKEKLIEYFASPQDLYIFEISSEASDFVRVPIDSVFRSDMQVIKRYLKSSSDRDTIVVSHMQFLSSAYRLYGKLLPGRVDAEKLLVIPEGLLAYFPFDILVSEPLLEFNGQFRTIPYLIRNHTIQYAYSATLLKTHSGHGRLKPEKLLAFAPGYMNSEVGFEPSGATREMHIDRSDLIPLPGSLREVEEIGHLTGGEVLTGTGASESSFRDRAPGSSIIHLATHAFLDDEDPLLSRLVFSEEPGGEEDGFLNVYEIYNLDLVASLVVLSACNTGAGLLKGGEGIMSLARAFLYAGVPNIVMTLWTVSDEQSFQLMKGFYSNLLRGKTTSEALRTAKLDQLNGKDLNLQHPQYWAGYISVGDNEIIFRQKNFNRMFLAILISAGLLAFIGLGIRKRRRREG